MRVTKDYVFALVERLGRAVAQKADALVPPPAPGTIVKSAIRYDQKAISDELWRIQKKVGYGDLTVREGVEALHRLSECHKLLVGNDWKEKLRSIAV